MCSMYGILTTICPNKITQFCKSIYQHHGSHMGYFPTNFAYVQLNHHGFSPYFLRVAVMFPFVPQPPWPPHHQASFAPRRAHLAHVPAASASLSVVERWNDPAEVYGLYGPWWVSHDFTLRIYRIC